MKRLVKMLAYLEKRPRGIVRALAILGGGLFLLDAILWAFGLYEEIPVWHGVYGFVMCVALVLGAKAMRPFLKRSETYYAPRAIDSEPSESPPDKETAP